jgi:hypothetical protein
MLFLSKDSSLAINLVEGLLKFWPFGNSVKEVKIINNCLKLFINYRLCFYLNF